MRLGVVVAGRGPEDIAARFEQARDAGYFICQFNLCQSGYSRADIVAIADSAVDLGIRPAAVGCLVNPLSPDQPTSMGGSRADLELLLHSLDILGARRIVLLSGTNAENIYDDHPDNVKPECVIALRDFLTDVVMSTRARHYFLCVEPRHTHVLRDEESIQAFHDSLEPSVQERVRYVLDVPSLITPDRYSDCDAAAEKICRTLGPLAGIVHLRDVVMPPDGDTSLLGPCQGKLDYAAYIEHIMANVGTDVPAIVRNVAIDEFAEVRDRLLRLTGRWELT